MFRMHKRFIALCTGILLFHAAFGQDEGDALRYSYLFPGGTARMQAIGGTGVSLGGDPGYMFMNPAGIGMFRTNDFSITSGFRSQTANSSYLQDESSDNKANLYIQQLGLVFASNKKRGSNSRWQNITFGLGLNRLANFNSNVYIRGVNDQSSYSEKYLEQLRDDRVTDPNDAASNYPYGASLAFNTYLIDTTMDAFGNITGYQSYVPLKPGILQENSISSRGGLNEFALSVAGNYDNKFYIGLALGVPSIKYRRVNTYSESRTEGNNNNGFQDFTLTENLNTDGVGINGKIGMIYAINSMIRIGAAFHSPTVYSMHDTYVSRMTTNTGNFNGSNSQSSLDLNDGYPGDYDYSLTTPWRAMGGLSVIFGTSPDVSAQHGFLSLDYEYVNYAAARFHFNGSNSTADDKAYANSLNRSISSMYKGASNVRLGGELKFNILAVRAGFAWIGSPYADSDIKGQQMRYSGGLGIRTHGIYADLSYIYSSRQDAYYPYLLEDKPVSPADLTYHSSNVVLTFGFEF